MCFFSTKKKKKKKEKRKKKKEKRKKKKEKRKKEWLCVRQAYKILGKKNGLFLPLYI